jgi:hypothetical protein
VKRRGRKKKRPPLQHTFEALVAHRELQYLRHPNAARAAKLKAVKRGKLL